MFRRSRPQPKPAGPGWTISDPPERIWDVSINHMGVAVKGFGTGSSYESLMSELLAAQLGFGQLSHIGYRSEFSGPLNDALTDWSLGMTLGDTERAGRGYESVRQLLTAMIAAEGG